MRLVAQLVHRPPTGPRHGLVGRDDDPLDARRRGGSGPAPRPSASPSSSGWRRSPGASRAPRGLTSATTSGTSACMRQIARVVDHDRAGLDQLRRPLGADRAAGRREDQVEALDRLARERPALQLAAVEAHLRARRALGGEGDHLGRREAALGEHLEHRRAHRPRGAEDPHAVAVRRHRGSRPRPRVRPDRRPVLVAGRLLAPDRVLAELERLVQRPAPRREPGRPRSRTRS